MEIIMKTFLGTDGNYADIPLTVILARMTDAWIDDEITGENISELRDTCRKLLETAHNSDYAMCKSIGCQFFDEKMEFNCCANENLCEKCINSQHLPGSSPG